LYYGFVERVNETSSRPNDASATASSEARVDDGALQ
jgi:hypothetical protein